ncbi:hypothetical protein CK203_048363 [Vitis vinifera]|uniref:Multiple myeloma tumor-associated protein 2-like N-terminal domain-containing protein n=1 Tax=Vitis vinifera TaxID=29760 RepID=A0A438HRF3_VITVI|nr:hypothetical protein CK203_048363 [Vitis vinifera]
MAVVELRSAKLWYPGLVGKDLHWYARDKKSESSDMEAAKEEIKRIKEQEEQAMREALGLAPKRANRSQGNRLDKHEFSELVKRGSTAEDLGAGHSEAAHVQGLGLRGMTGKVSYVWL